MRKLLTGVSDNITTHIDKILLWKKSFIDNTDQDVILLAFNATEEDINTLEKHNIQYQTVSNDSSETVNNSRLMPVSSFIREQQNKYDVILYTDVFDVAFIRDPFEDLDLVNYDVFVAGEGVTHNEEPWNTDVMQKCFSNRVPEMQTKEIFCSGVIAGKPKELANFIDDMWLMLLKSEKGHDIADQAALNLVVNDSKDLRLKRMYLSDNWCIHLAVGGPTDFFEAWGFRNAIQKRYGFIPYWSDYAIIHQFNRTPPIHKSLQQMFKL